MNEHAQTPPVDVLRMPYCIPDASGHCLTCSDEAIPVRVLQVDVLTGLALVSAQGARETPQTEEIDITLLDEVCVGDTLLAHGGVAIGRLDPLDSEARQ